VLAKVAAFIEAATGGIAHTAMLDVLDEAAMSTHAAGIAAEHGLHVAFNATDADDIQGTPLLKMDHADVCTRSRKPGVHPGALPLTTLKSAPGTGCFGPSPGPLASAGRCGWRSSQCRILTLRQVALGSCHRPYGTPCIHAHASTSRAQDKAQELGSRAVIAQQVAAQAAAMAQQVRAQAVEKAQHFRERAAEKAHAAEKA
jgi:hypothetical protein